MSPGLAFLNKKGFHTKRLDNVEKVPPLFMSTLFCQSSKLDVAWCMRTLELLERLVSRADSSTLVSQVWMQEQKKIAEEKYMQEKSRQLQAFALPR